MSTYNGDCFHQKARLLASLTKTSINAIVRQRLEEFVSSAFSRQAALMAGRTLLIS
ncbi:MAG: hypothetical protein JRI33_00590 [Deltaproteobacteria bacterium]|nr:hypothetical protein [Deltaproteobacteria bacterium]